MLVEQEGQQLSEKQLYEQVVRLRVSGEDKAMGMAFQLNRYYSGATNAFQTKFDRLMTRELSILESSILAEEQHICNLIKDDSTDSVQKLKDYASGKPAYRFVNYAKIAKTADVSVVQSDPHALKGLVQERFFYQIFSSRSLCTLVELQFLTAPEYIQLEALLNSLGRSIIKSRIIFEAAIYNFSADSFHQICDKVSKCLFIAKSKEQGLIFGAYSDKAFEEQSVGSGYIMDSGKSTFIFTMGRPWGSSVHRLKSHMTTNALQYNRHSGPIYGNNDLHIGDKCDYQTSCLAQMGSAFDLSFYQAGSEGASKFLGGESQFSLQNYFVIRLN